MNTLTRAVATTAATALTAGAAIAVIETSAHAASKPKTSHTVTVAEGGQARITVTLKKPAKKKTKVVWKTQNGTATAGADYTAVKKGRVILAKGQRSAELTVATLDDSAAEGAEYFYVKFHGKAKGVKLKDPKVRVVVTDDDTLTPSSMPTTTVTVSPGTPGA